MADVNEKLQKLQDWLREPDFAEHFGTDDLVDWLNRRPTSVIPSILATRAAPPAMDREAVRIAREELGEPQEWIDRLDDLYGWTGSAWLAGETNEQPEGLQAFLTSLIGFLLCGRDAAKALSTLSADAIRQGEGKTLAYAIKQAKQNLALTQGCMECNAADERRWQETITWLGGLA